MIGYQIRLAWKSLRRSPGHAVIVACGIAVGVAVATVFAAVRHSFVKDPIPHRSDVLYYVRMDNRGPAQPHEDGQPPDQITYQDMVALLRSDIPVRQTGSFESILTVHPDPVRGRPWREQVRLCFADFFPMFDVPFRYGSGWDRAADEGPQPVVVLSSEMNERLFGGEDSVGRNVRIEDREFRVVGVLDHWRPSVKSYDMNQLSVEPPEPIYLPFRFLVPMNLETAGNFGEWKGPPAPGLAGILASERTWIQMWVELPTRDHVDRYRAFLDAYALDQRKVGRFQRPLDNRLSRIQELMDDWNTMPPELDAMVVVSVLFLAICALNLVGLLLGKFLARGAEIGVRRAMGARRADVFVQHILECEVLALVGGAIGLLVALGGITGLNVWIKIMIARDDFVQMDWAVAGFAIAAALVAGLVASVYPAARVCRISPAIHLKRQ